MRTRPGLVATLALSVIGALSPPPAAADSKFGGPVDIGTLPGGSFAQAIAVNDAGQVVGFADLPPSASSPDGAVHAISWTMKRGMVDLGTLGGRYSSATGVNASGQVMGTSDLPGGGPPAAFSWTATSGMVNISGITEAPSNPTAMADSGQVIGTSSPHGPDPEHPHPPMTAFSWTPAGGTVHIGSLGGPYTTADAVNNVGMVVGSSSTGGYTEHHAYVWTAAGGMRDLGTLGGSFSGARAVSDSGQVVGFSTIPGDEITHPFSWTKAGGMVDLGLGPSWTWAAAEAVTEAGQVFGRFSRVTENGGVVGGVFSWTAEGGLVDIGTLGGDTNMWAVSDSGQVVGYSRTPSGCDGLYIQCADRAFSWTSEGGMVDIGTLGGSHSYASAVNASGVVVGFAETPGFDGAVHAFSWTAEQGIVDLGTLGGVPSSTARAVNNANLVIGNSGEHGNRGAVWQLPLDKGTKKAAKKA